MCRPVWRKSAKLHMITHILQRNPTLNEALPKTIQIHMSYVGEVDIDGRLILSVGLGLE